MKFLTAGESHGKGLVAILDGLPSNLQIDINKIQHQLKRRQMGYGRGGRMKIEGDKLEIFSGVRGSLTLGSPISFVIFNSDFKNWEKIMGAENADLTARTLTKVRPGHADLAGCIKYAHTDARNILERASARETAARVGVGAFCRQLLELVGITIGSHVTKIAGVKSCFEPESAVGLNEFVDGDKCRCGDKNASELMVKSIDECIASGDTAGGEVEVVISGMPVGVGSCMQYDRKLDYILTGLLGGIQAVKSVSIGAGERVGEQFGSKIHDKIYLDENKKVIRKTNSAGGIEGGISNGENIIIRLSVKPIPTLMKGLDSIDIREKVGALSQPERSDYCAVPAAGVVAEAVAAYAICDALLACTGGDTAAEVKDRVMYMRLKNKL